MKAGGNENGFKAHGNSINSNNVVELISKIPMTFTYFIEFGNFPTIEGNFNYIVVKIRGKMII